MGLKKPVISEIAYRTYAINEYGMASCFLLEGKERALLIDTGCGMSNIKEIADSLTKLPYDVAVTHGHGDHIGSIDKWDKVWLHPADWDVLSLDNLAENTERLEAYPGMMANFGTFETYDVTPEQIRYPRTLPEFLPLEDGQIFELGGRDVEVIHIPGHTPGECVFMDPNSRIMFSGDACNINLGLSACSVTTSLRALLRLKEREDEFDQNYNSHIGYGGNPDCFSMPESVLDDCLYILKSILKGTAEVQTMPDGGIFPSRHFVRYGTARISFDPDRLIDEGETALL